MLDMISSLLQATQGLLVTSETDAPLDLFLWPRTVPWTVERTLAFLALPATTPLEQITLEHFLRPRMAQYDGQTYAEAEQARRFQELYKLLTEYMSDIHVLRIGEIEISVWIVGTNKEGRSLGFTTLLVET